MRVTALVVFLLTWLVFPASAPSQPAATVRAVLASARLPSVVDAPRSFVVRRITLAAKQTVAYPRGPVGMALLLAGSLEIESGADRRQLAKGEGSLIAPGSTLRATGADPAVLVHFALATTGELDRAIDAGSGNVVELFRTAPLRDLQPGPYEFSLVRVTFPSRFPMNPPHRRSGAAMYYVLEGTGTFTSGGNTEKKPAGIVHFEPHDLVHQWANPGDVPLVLIQANISQEGVPAVIFLK
jgi:quercetin dioxygenase-like cupin family protein